MHLRPLLYSIRTFARYAPKIDGSPTTGAPSTPRTVLTTEGHTGVVYELGGDEAFTLAELAAAISA